MVVALGSNEVGQETPLPSAALGRYAKSATPATATTTSITLMSKWPTNLGLHFPEGADLDARDSDEFENDPGGGFEPGVVWLTTARATD